MALPKKLVSIDIGNEWIKVAYIQRKGKKSHFVFGEKIPTPERAVQDGGLSNLTEMAQLIRNVLDKNQIKEKHVVFSVSSSKIITREVELPHVPYKKLKNIIELNADEYFPVNLAEYCLDFTISEIIETEEGKKIKVNIVAALKKLIQTYIELARDCHLEIVGVDFSGNSMVNFVQYEKYEGTNLFLNIGPESTMVTIVSNGVVKFSRNILFGTQAIHNSICQHFDVDYNAAVALAKERQLLNPNHKDNPYLHSDVTSGMEQILNGVARLIDYYSSRNPNPIEQIYIMDGGSEIAGAQEYISKFFGLTVKKVNGFDNFIINSAGVSVDELHYYPIALGATLSTMNLLPLSIKNKDELQAKKRIPILISILLMVALGAHFYQGYAQYTSLERTKRQIEQDIHGMSDIHAIIEEHKVALEERDFRIKIENMTTTQSDGLLTFIQELERTMPEQGFLSAINVTSEALTMNASFRDEETLAQMLTYLKKQTVTSPNGESLPMFEEVYIPAVNRIGEADSESTIVSAMIQCTYSKQEVTDDDQ